MDGQPRMGKASSRAKPPPLAGLPHAPRNRAHGKVPHHCQGLPSKNLRDTGTSELQRFVRYYSIQEKRISKRESDL